jgi:hypothetical protein
MPRFITANNLLIFLIAASGCQETPEPDTPPVPEDSIPPFETLLLPEDRDTTTVFNALPDSAFDGLRFDSSITIFGKPHLYLTFDHLKQVTFREDISTEGYYFLKPFFGADVQRLNHKPVNIRGFLVPVSHSEGFYALSALPYQSCFFCGGAGPESVIDIRFLSRPDLPKTADAIITLAGTLRLNDSSFYDLCYILEGAVVVAE